MNTFDDFRIKLFKPLILTGGVWKVGLCEIHIVGVKVTEEVVSLDKRKLPMYLQVEFESCGGLLMHGDPSHIIRTIPYVADGREIFTAPFYVPIQTGYIDTCHIRIKVLGTNPIHMHESHDTCITCTLHFKKVSDKQRL